MFRLWLIISFIFANFLIVAGIDTTTEFKFRATKWYDPSNSIWNMIQTICENVAPEIANRILSTPMEIGCDYLSNPFLAWLGCGYITGNYAPRLGKLYGNFWCTLLDGESLLRKYCRFQIRIAGNIAGGILGLGLGCATPPFCMSVLGLGLLGDVLGEWAGENLCYIDTNQPYFPLDIPEPTINDFIPFPSLKEIKEWLKALKKWLQKKFGTKRWNRYLSLPVKVITAIINVLCDDLEVKELLWDFFGGSFTKFLGEFLSRPEVPSNISDWELQPPFPGKFRPEILDWTRSPLRDESPKKPLIPDFCPILTKQTGDLIGSYMGTKMSKEMCDIAPLGLDRVCEYYVPNYGSEFGKWFIEQLCFDEYVRKEPTKKNVCRQGIRKVGKLIGGLGGAVMCGALFAPLAQVCGKVGRFAGGAMSDSVSEVTCSDDPPKPNEPEENPCRTGIKTVAKSVGSIGAAAACGVLIIPLVTSLCSFVGNIVGGDIGDQIGENACPNYVLLSTLPPTPDSNGVIPSPATQNPTRMYTVYTTPKPASQQMTTPWWVPPAVVVHGMGVPFLSPVLLPFVILPFL